MQTQQIPRDEWLRFFDGFSRRHRGESATVVVMGARLGAQIEANRMPLEGIVAPVEERGPISVFLGAAPPRSNLEHEIRDPGQVWVDRSDDGDEEALNIESGDGTKTLILFRP